MGSKMWIGKGLKKKKSVKMLTGYSSCLVPTKECQSWLRHGLYVFGWRKKERGKSGKKRKGNITQSLAFLVLVLVKN